MPVGNTEDMAGRDLDLLAEVREMHARLAAEIGKVIVGQREIVDQLLTALFCEGHVLIVGVPGLAKTLLVKTLADILDWRFKRIQFTPDMMPSDIIGTELIQEDRTTGQRELRFTKGPVFANIVLGDEINRAPPKTQAALLEAMQEQHVTAAGTNYALDRPFVVVATQNPIEQEGTYPLPEAQLDRFMFNLWIDYPDQSEEEAIVEQTTAPVAPKLERLLSRERMIEYQQLVRRVPVSRHVVQYACAVARASRPRDKADAYIRQYVEWGAGPRASQYLVLAAKARAVLVGRPAPSVDDVRRVALPVLRHRVIPNYNATGDGITAVDIVGHLLDQTPEPAYER
ncbi:MAG: MoxR family ATPase [Phycisphaerae bacterium]|nr:MoxR family ATPase [Phycisphaerae bacterium]